MSWDASVCELPSHTARSSTTSPSAATDCTAVIPSTSEIASVYAATSASEAPSSSRLADDCSGPNSVASFSNATCAGASSGSTR